MHKLLIAEADPILRDTLARTLKEDWEILTCADGDGAVQMIQTHQPEGLVLNLKLPGKSGFDVLAACFPRLPAVILALSGTVDHKTELAAMRWGVDFLFEIPCRLSKIRQSLACGRAMDNIQMKRATNHLRVLGAHSGDKGYCCLMAAVPLFRADPEQGLKTELYPQVAELIGLSDYRCVERDIRFAIQRAWKNRVLEDWALYFPKNKDGDVDCPCNKDFIACLAYVI